MNTKRILLLCIIIIFVMVGYGIVIPLTSFFKENLGFTNIEVALLFSLYALGQLISAPLIGISNDIYGNKKSIVIGFLLFIIFFTITFSIKIPYLILFFRFLSGVLGGIVTISIENYIGQNSKEVDKVKFFTYTSLSIGIGMTLGPIIGVLIIVAQKIVLSSILVISILLIIIVYYKLKDDKTTLNTEPVKSQFYNSFIKSIKNKFNIFILAVFFLFGFISSSFEYKIFDFIKYNYKIVNTSIILVLLCLLLGIVYIIILNPKIVYKMSRINYISKNLVMIIISFIIIIFSKNNINLFIFGITLLIIYLATLISTLTTIITIVNYKSGFILGLRNSFLSVGAIFGPLITAFLDTYNQYFIFGFIIFMLAIILIYSQIKLKDL